MKKLYLLRHANAAHPQGVEDNKRPLNDKGRLECKDINLYIKDSGLLPELVLCSDSFRTTSTFKGVFSEIPDVKVEYNAKLYHATPGEILKEIGKVNSNLNSLMVIGHNPGMQQLASILATHGDIEIFKSIKKDYPTCALSEFTFNITSWQDVEVGTGILENYITPDKY